MNLHFSFLTALLCLAVSVSGQDTLARRPMRLEVSASGGVSPYQGDVVKPRISMLGSGPAVRWALGYQLSSRFMLTGDLFLSTFSASDFDYGREKRGISIVASAVGAGVNSLFFLTPFERPKKKFIVVPGVLAGIGGLVSSTTVAGLPVSSPDAGLESARALYGQLGVGLYFQNWEGWVLSLESRKLFSNSDYLDGVSKAGNPSNNDGLLMLTIGVGKRF